MDAIECIKTRRSIRKFQDKDVPEDIITDIIDCARKAPSGHNDQSWAFIVIRDQNRRELLSKVQKWCSFIAESPVCIIVCCTPSEHQTSSYLSASCATQNIMLSAHSYGLGTCWCYVKDFEDSSVEDRVKDILKIPEETEVLCMIPIGYPKAKPGGRKLKKIEKIVHKEEWKV